jgi:subtilisin family serine protease
MKATLFVLGLMTSMALQASTIAIIDSGTDMQHQDITSQAWINPNEIAGNDRDEDRNGYQDDIYGWNFAENNSEVIDYRYLGTLTQDVRRFFDIQSDAMLGQATQEDIAWMRKQIENKDFVKQLQIYGNFMHGTHVGAIAIKNSPEAKLLAVKLIPTEVKLPFTVRPREKGIGMFLLKKALGVLAQQQMKMMVDIGHYIAGHGADIANGSFGTGYNQAKMIVETIIKTFVKNPKQEDIHEGTIHFLNTLIAEGKNFVGAAPKTLFVFAAGNDGVNNDKFPTSPANIQADNVVTVAASIGRQLIAPFSNYGDKSVDVAAPGVAIESAAPGNNYIRVSGTSQAAPYVAQVASGIKDANSKLTPAEIKKIIVETVDKKDWLAGKVVTSGLVNKERAILAAQLSGNMALAQAISESQKRVSEVASGGPIKSATQIGKVPVMALPSPFKLVK